MSSRAETPTDRPFDRSYWVVEGRLIAGCYPGSLDRTEMEARLTRMMDLGIRHFVNLMEEDERDHSGNPFRSYEGPALELAERRGLAVSCSRFPIRDMGVPSRDTMTGILNDVDRAMDAGRIVYVHCWGGRGRTGTVIGCWLIRHGLAGRDTVLERIAELRQVIPVADRRPSPETPQQVEYVRGWQ